MIYVPIDVTEEEYKEVYATFGLVVYLAQCFERQNACFERAANFI